MRVRNLTLKKQVARLQKDNLMLSKENIDLKQKASLSRHFASDVERKTMEFKDACKVITIEVAEEMAELGIYSEVDNGSSVRFVSVENGKA